MKKITSYLSIVVLTFALAACSVIGGNTPEKVSEDFFNYLNQGNKSEAMKLISSDASALSDTEVSLAIEGLKVISKSLKVYNAIADKEVSTNVADYVSFDEKSKEDNQATVEMTIDTKEAIGDNGGQFKTSTIYLVKEEGNWKIQSIR